MFRRTDKTAETTSAPADVAVKPGGKGRPTPTRKEAEAAARERARAGMDKKAAQKVLRDQRAESNRKMREGIKRGDEQYLPQRDKGPVRRYVRNWVDSRLSFTEFLVPVLLVMLLLSANSNRGVQLVAAYLQLVIVMLFLVDVVWIRLRLMPALKAKFPGQSLRGTVLYALIRMMQVRFLRRPAPQVKIGERPS